MMSRAAFNLANCIATGGISLHDLRSSMVYAESIDRSVVDHYVRDGLRELIVRNWLKWTFESDYGRTTPELPTAYDLASFDRDWQRCLVADRIREVTPDSENPTLYIEAQDALLEELDKPEYSLYDLD